MAFVADAVGLGAAAYLHYLGMRDLGWNSGDALLNYCLACVMLLCLDCTYATNRENRSSRTGSSNSGDALNPVRHGSCSGLISGEQELAGFTTAERGRQVKGRAIAADSFSAYQCEPAMIVDGLEDG